MVHGGDSAFGWVVSDSIKVGLLSFLEVLCVTQTLKKLDLKRSSLAFKRQIHYYNICLTFLLIIVAIFYHGDTRIGFAASTALTTGCFIFISWICITLIRKLVRAYRAVIRNLPTDAIKKNDLKDRVLVSGCWIYCICCVIGWVAAVTTDKRGWNALKIVAGAILLWVGGALLTHVFWLLRSRLAESIRESESLLAPRDLKKRATSLQAMNKLILYTNVVFLGASVAMIVLSVEILKDANASAAEQYEKEDETYSFVQDFPMYCYVLFVLFFMNYAWVPLFKSKKMDSNSNVRPRRHARSRDTRNPATPTSKGSSGRFIKKGSTTAAHSSQSSIGRISSRGAPSTTETPSNKRQSSTYSADEPSKEESESRLSARMPRPAKVSVRFRSKSEQSMASVTDASESNVRSSETNLSLASEAGVTKEHEEEAQSKLDAIVEPNDDNTEAKQEAATVDNNATAEPNDDDAEAKGNAEAVVDINLQAASQG